MISKKTLFFPTSKCNVYSNLLLLVSLELIVKFTSKLWVKIDYKLVLFKFNVLFKHLSCKEKYYKKMFYNKILFQFFFLKWKFSYYSFL